MSADQPTDDALRDLPQLAGVLLDHRPGSAPLAGQRFHTGRLLGAGGIGRVVAVTDRNLEREIAVKTLLPGQGDDAAVAALITEARITARLEHPGIVPVHDLAFSPDGQIYYAMRRIQGRSLGALVAEAQRSGERPAALADANQLVTILLKVCDALAYAHSHDVVHRDLKPDNIMLGDFGEVLVLDWGASSVLAGTRVGPPGPGDQLGTPAFMSPEQARCDGIDARSDVWSLGATLFNMLFLRFPFAHAEQDAFWQGKRAGTVTPPMPAELHALNRPLAAIALRAMRADPAERYQTVAAVADDLRAYQAGHAMVAYRGSPWERFRRWHRYWGRTCWTVLAIITVAAVVGWFIWGERLKQIATWGAPIAREDYADDSWRERWTSTPADSFVVRDGRLVSAANLEAIAWYRPQLAGPVAIEFDGEIMPGSPPCDLSVLWCNGPLDPAHPKFPRNGWQLQAGAFDDTVCAIYRNTDGMSDLVARTPLRLVPGRVQRIRAELDGCTLRLAVDGVVVAEFEDALPIQPGHIGIYGYYAGKAFDHVRIYARGVAERISPISLGDDNLNDGLYTRAIERYQRVLSSHPSGPLADEAWYKIGYCQRQAGDEAAAWSAWSHVSAPPFSDRVACHELDRLFETGRHDELLARLPEVVGRSPVARSQAEGLWSKWSTRLRYIPSAEHTLLERYLAIRMQLFPGDGPSITGYGHGLNTLHRWDQIVAECGDDQLSVIDALASLGRPDEAIERFGRIGWAMPRLNRQNGDLEGNLTAIEPRDRAIALAKLGRLAEVPDLPKATDWRILAAAGDWPGLLARPDDEDGVALALLATGRIQEAIAGSRYAPPRPSSLALALSGRQAEAESAKPALYNTTTLRLLAALAANDLPLAASLRQQVQEMPLDWQQPTAWFGPCIVVPFLALQADHDTVAWHRALENARAVKRRAGQRLWHLAGFLDGTLTADQLLAQPYRAEAEAWLRIATGLRADAAGDAVAARAAYRAFQALPLPERLLADFSPDPAVERFVAWRLQVLR